MTGRKKLIACALVFSGILVWLLLPRGEMGQIEKMIAKGDYPGAIVSLDNILRRDYGNQIALSLLHKEIESPRLSISL